MKVKGNLKGYFSILILFIYITSTNALSISVTSASFQNSKSKYLEVYIQVIGNSVTYIPTDSNYYSAMVDFTLLLKKKGQIVNFDKFSLQSPLSTFHEDFIGIRRIKIDTGEYTLEVAAIDTNKKSDTFTYSNSIKVELDPKEICISGIQLLAEVTKNSNTNNPFVKNGFYLEPALSYFLPQKVNTLGIYLEIYNLNKSKTENKITLLLNKGYKGTQSKTILKKSIRHESMSITPILTKIDISGLSSGNYHIEIQVLDNNNIVTSSKFVNFQRSNPISDPKTIVSSKNTFKNSFVNKIPSDSLYYSLKALAPISTSTNSVALNQIIGNKNDKKARYFLWKFWIDKNEMNPEIEYKEYMKYAVAVDKTFRSQVGYGFETDRGTVYLKYGKPSQIIKQTSEPNAPPYEIWFYDMIEQDQQRNVKFLFYAPSLAHNDYQLLHSTCRGERNNPMWIYKLYSKRTDANSQNNKQAQLADYYELLKNSYDNNAVRIWEELK